MTLAHGIFRPVPWPWMWILPVIGLAVMFFVAVLVFRRCGWMSWCMGGRNGPAEGTDASAMDILKRRYASGEITREEFERMKRDIEA